MPVDRPYRRTCRQFVDGEYLEGGRWQYMAHAKFAQSPEHYVRAFLLLLKDVQELFDYVEPADNNMGCYSYRIHALLLRACVEVEANCKAILKENGYAKAGDWNMRDYRKVEQTHLLSQYEVSIPNWTGAVALRKPFGAWSSTSELPWYKAYNTTKHDRQNEFQQATFEHLIDAVCGLLVVLSSQFAINDFSPGPGYLLREGPNDGFETGIGGYFRVRYPQNFPIQLRYDFDWQQLKLEVDPFKTFDYATV